MPLYKLHDAPRAGPSFGNHTVPNAVPSHPNRRPPHGPLSAPPTTVTSLQQTVPKPPQQQPTPAVAPSSSEATQQAAASSPETSPKQRALPTPETAHSSHSLYFIEHLFPSKLWRILDDAERCGYADVISWVDDGMAFQIHDRERVIPILEKYFSMSKYKSFLRQLQAYGFKRELPNAKDDPTRETVPKKEHHRGKWKHALFRRDKVNLCNKMTREGKKEKEDDNQGAATVGSIKKESGVQPRPGTASMTGQQQREQQQRRRQGQQIHDRMLQQQQQRPPLFHQDPRFPRHHPLQPPFHQQHIHQRLHPHHRLPQVPQHHPPASASFLACVEQQQKEDHHRRQLQLQINQMNEQQFLSRLTGAPPLASQTLLTGVNYNKPSIGAPSPSIGVTKGATDAVSEAANELRMAEMALAERRRRLAEAQERAQKESEALAKAEAALVKARVAPSSPSQTLAAQSTVAASLREHSQAASTATATGMKRPPPSSSGSTEVSKKRVLGDPPLTSILEDLNNAFLSSGSGEQQVGKKASQDTALKISDEELLRARAEATKSPQPLSAVAKRNPIAQMPSAAEREVMMARFNAVQQIREREQQQMGHQQLLMKISMAEKEESTQRKKVDAVTVRDAIRNAGVGLIGGDVLGKGPSAASATSHLSSGIKGMQPISAIGTAAMPEGILSKEMMDIFAQTAAAAISGKKSDGSSKSSPNFSQAATATNSRTASPALKVPPTIADAAKLAASVTSKDRVPAPLGPDMTPSKIDTVAKSPFLSTSSHVIDNEELEAARVMMKIPGTIQQTSKGPMKGHWELVHPDNFRKGTPLAKALPEVVSKSSGLTYDTYKAMSQKMTPPKVMKIPEGWDSTKEPVYLLVDPAKAGESAKSKGFAAGVASS